MDFRSRIGFDSDGIPDAYDLKPRPGEPADARIFIFAKRASAYDVPRPMGKNRVELEK